MPSETPPNYMELIRDTRDPLYSPQYQRWLASRNNSTQERDEYVWVDAHVLHTPVVVDIDNDGNDELLVPVSYYFDR